MRRNVLLCLYLTLSACTGSAISRATPGSGGPSPVATADSTILRRLMGQEVLDQPLLPQPGNIWADVLPAVSPGPPSATPGSIHAGDRPVAAAAPGARLRHPAASVTTAIAPAAAVTLVAAVPRIAAVPLGGVPLAGAVPVAKPVPPAAAMRQAGPVRAVVPATAKAMPPAAFHLMVQLAAARSAQSAEAEWRRLRQHAPTLTDGHLPAVSEAEVNGQHVWRLRAAGFADAAEAAAFCTGIRTVQANCWVVPPSASR